MNRKIQWVTGRYDEIELVYERAEGNDAIGKLLEQLEEKALAEAKENCGLIKNVGEKGYLTPDQFDGLNETEKEIVLLTLGAAGLQNINTDYDKGEIRILLSPAIQQVMGCTFFNLLNRFEKLDGALNIIKPKWTVVLLVPLGGRKGLLQWELLVMQMFPWISFRETSSGQAAAEMVSGNNTPPSPPKEPAAAEEPVAPPKESSAPEKKKSFFRRLFSGK